MQDLWTGNLFTLLYLGKTYWPLGSQQATNGQPD